MYKAIITGIGSYVPEQIISNFDLEKMVETNDEWIKQRTGISQRRIASPDQSTSDLSVEAGLKAIEDSGLEKEEIDCVIVATSSPDHILPPVACLVQHKLGLKNVAGFDVSATCTGFINALSIGEQYIKAGRYKNILIIGAETLSRLVNWEDRSTCIIFSDGAGAVVLSRANQDHPAAGIIYSSTHMDGQYFNDLIVPAGGVNEPIDENSLNNKRNKISMTGNRIFKQAVQSMVSVAKEALINTGLTLDDLNWIIPHQANTRIIEAVTKGLGASTEIVIQNIENFGNNSAATIPLAFDINYKNGVIKKGEKIMFVAFGGGLTWGAVILEL